MLKVVHYNSFYFSSPDATKSLTNYKLKWNIKNKAAFTLGTNELLRYSEIMC